MKMIYLFPYLANRPAPIQPTNVRQDHPYRNREDFYEFDVNELENYSTYNLNWHHYTTATIWNVVFPKFMHDFKFEYDPNDYTYVSNNRDGVDLGFHDYNKEMDIQVVTEENKVYDHLRDTYGTQFTAYHRLFVAPHKIAVVTNNKALTDRIIRLNCDSMIIPLVPLIAPYFKKMYVYDYRSNYRFEETNDITDELSAYISYNFNRIFGK